MAEYRLHYKKGKVGVAKAHAEYILRENKYSKAKEDLIYKESGNMDCIIDGTSAIDFWESADNFERINGVSYRELELNIPNEFNHEQGIELVQDFIKKEIGYKYPYSFAIHESHNKDGEKNLHCHLMFSERELDDVLRTKEQFFKRANSKKPELGGAKKDNIWRKKEQLLSLRKSWEVITNTALEKNGFDERVSCESLKKQREEAIKKEQYNKADFLDRTPVNILGKTLRKIKRVGFKNLSKEEQESITKYKEAKEIRASKKREYEIKKGNVVPTKEECQLKLNKITNTTEEDLKLKALNIITKGAFYSHSKILRKIENQLLIDPLNEILRKQEKELKETINSLKLENENNPKYKRIYEQINRDFEKEKEIYQVASKDYGIDKLEFLQEEKITKFYENKYKNASSESLEFRMKELEVENPRELAKNVLTNFRLEAITKDIMINEKLKESLSNKIQTQLMIGEREGYKESDLKLKEIEKKLDYKYKEYDLMIDELEKQKEKELIPNKKSLEKEAKRLLESCNLKINSLNKTVDTLEKGKEKLDKFTSEKKLGNGYTTIQLLALNKITKGEYNKVFFEAKKISKDINNLEKELSQTSKVNFIKRSSISKDIETLKINYNKCKSSEENLLKKYKDSDYLKDVSFTIDKCLNTAKKRVEKENKSLKEDRNIQYLIKRKLNEIVGLEREFKPYTKNKPIQIQKDLKHTLGGLKKALVQDKKPNQNNLEIKLQKEKEGWEL